MKECDRISSSIAGCPVYESGRPIETVARELGLKPKEIIKLASNENPLGPSPRALEAIARESGRLHDYPDGGGYRLRRKLAEKLDLSPNQILTGNGSNEVLEMVATAYLQPGQSAVFGEYGFIVYRLATLHAKAEPIAVKMPDLAHDIDLMLEAVRPDTRVLFLASPNNPTGSTVPTAELYRLADSLPEDVLFCFDEAYAEYLDEAPDFRSRIRDGRRILCVRTFSKIYGLAGLRVGYAYGSAEIIETLNRVRQPFNVGSLGQAGATAALDDDAHLEESRSVNRAGMERLRQGLEKMGATFRTTEANFILVQVPSGEACFEVLLQEGVIIRPLGPYGLGSWIRVTVGTPEQVERFLATFGAWWRGMEDNNETREAR